jgi:curved DNA-binding protein CbpA
MTETFYEVLGVDPDASTSDIETAYRERLKETHPDHNDDADADRATQRVIEARDVLTDDEERARYDRIGHEAYVDDGSTAPSDDPEPAGAATRAAREAGWADADTNGPSESTAAGTNAGPSERRRREWTASERVRQAREASAAGRSRRATVSEGGTATGRTTASGGTTTDRSAGGGTATAGSTTTQTRRTAGASARSDRERERIYGTDNATASAGYNVRRNVRSGGHPVRRLLADAPLSLVALTFFLYPVLLFSTVFPPFQLVVNVTVGLCTLLLVGYLQSQPSAGILVFGTWSLLVPLGLVVFGVSPTGFVGLIALGGTLLPFGFSVLTQSILRL